MKTLTSHGRKDQIVINVAIDYFATEFFKRVNKRLKESYVFNYQQEGNKLKFKGSIFRFAWNGWDLFNSFTQGEIEFFEEKGNPFIKHKINFTEAFVIALLFNIIPLFTLKYEPGWSIFIFCIIWLLYFVNYLIAVFRFNSYISNTLIFINQTVGYEFISNNKAKA